MHDDGEELDGRLYYRVSTAFHLITVMHLDCMNEYQQEVIEYFGYWPAFCDAHILSCSEAENNLFLKIDYIDSEKSLHAEVQITFKSIFEVNLERYENNSVIDTLSILSGNNHWVTIEPCFGFGGTFKCRSIEAKIVKA